MSSSPPSRGDRTIPATDRSAIPEATSVLPSSQHITAVPTAIPVSTAPRIGDYTILGELGRGGMGVVYKAAQAGLNRLVALKMVLDGRAGPEALSRFKAEAVAVARLKHPNIVQIYEVGENQGNPYFSLEYVDGGTLAQQIAGQPQPTRWAASLIELLARAMDYAHEQGIVHRDLKPGNILIAMDGTPKITDFGLAKQMQGTDSETKTGAILGTPSYIAPEQAAAKKDVGPPVDIYALGAILYEMLTGRPPFKGETPMDTMLQVVSEEVVPPTQLNPKVPRDLETISLKCLQKEPGKRYRTAAALADDLQRFLAGEPIAARPVRGVEKVWRWCRRRPSVAVLIAMVFLVTIVGMAGVFWQWQSARANFAEAEQQRQRAEDALKTVSIERDRMRKDYEQARRIIDDFFVKISDQNLRNVPGLQTVRKEFLEAALKYYEGFLQQHSDDPALRGMLAEAHYNVGKVALELGRLNDAEKEFRKALALQKELLAATPSDHKVKRAAASTWVGLARVHTRLRRISQADDAYIQARTLMEELVRAAPAKDDGLDDLLFIYDGVAQLRRLDGKLEQALHAYEDGAALLRKLIASQATGMRQWKLAIFCKNSGELYAILQQPARARAALSEARRLLEPLVRNVLLYPRSELESHLGLVYVALSQLPRVEAQPDDPQALLSKARELLEKVVRENPAVAAFRSELAGTLMVQGNVFLERRQARDAITVYEQARVLRLALAREDPSSVPYQEVLVTVHICCARARLADGQTAAARNRYQEARSIQELLVRNHPEIGVYKQQLDSIIKEAEQVREKKTEGP
jgi:serine/threonine protein kinase/tetratricopeptide (TPR) repeat protein